MKNIFNNINIGIFDSGIGGIAVLNKLYKQINYDKIIYLSDNKNLPFGNKSKEELISIAIKNINILLTYNVNIIVFACNTITTSILKDIIPLYKIKFFGVFPPIDKEYIYNLKTNTKTLFLATDGTINALNNININYIKMHYLADEIEKKYDNFSSLQLKNNLPDITGYQRLILGCTHYELVEEEFKKIFKGEIVSGSDFTIYCIKKYLSNFKKYNYKREVVFIGDNKEKNMKIFQKCQKNTKINFLK